MTACLAMQLADAGADLLIRSRRHVFQQKIEQAALALQQGQQTQRLRRQTRGFRRLRRRRFEQRPDALGRRRIAKNTRERLAGEAELGEAALAHKQDDQQLHDEDRGHGHQRDLIRFHER
jgi:hypothetical protein